MPAQPTERWRCLGEDLGGGVAIKGEPKDPPVHVGDIEVVVRRWISVEGQAEQPHIGVWFRCNASRPDEVASFVGGEAPLAVRVEMPACSRRSKEIAGTGRDVNPVLVDGDAEGVPRRRHGREDADVTNRWVGRFARNRGRKRWCQRHRPQNSNDSQFHHSSSWSSWIRTPDKTVPNRLTVRSERKRKVEAGELLVADRKEVVDLGDLVVLDGEDLEGAQAILPCLVALVGGKSRAPVSPCCHEAEPPSGSAGKELGLEKPPDRGAALVPKRQRRHRDQRILTKQGHQTRSLRRPPRLPKA